MVKLGSGPHALLRITSTKRSPYKNLRFALPIPNDLEPALLIIQPVQKRSQW